jgi:hypothetical protein
MKTLLCAVHQVVQYFLNPPPSNLIFWTLVISILYLLFQVEMQGRIIKIQINEINYLLGLRAKP